MVKENFWGNENVLYLDWGDGYRGVYICHNLIKLYM